MTPERDKLLSAALLVLLAAAPVTAEPFTSEDVLRVTFDGRQGAFPPFEFDAFEFALVVVSEEPIGSFTTKLLDRGRLLGTYTGADPGAGANIVISRFKEPTSIYTRGNPTVVDLSSFHDGTFDGGVEFTIQTGRADIRQTSDDVTLGLAVTPSVLFSFNLFPVSYEITRGPDGMAPVPEPGSLLLLSGSVAGLAARRWIRRGDRRQGDNARLAERTNPSCAQ